MTRIVTALVASAFALLTASCCCTGESKPPRLRYMPKFKELPAESPAAAPAAAPEVISEK